MCVLSTEPPPGGCSKCFGECWSGLGRTKHNALDKCWVTISDEDCPVRMAPSAHSSLQKFPASVDHTTAGEGDGSAQAGSLGLLTDWPAG